MKLNIEKLGKNKSLLSIILAFIILGIIFSITNNNIILSIDKKIQHSYYSVLNNDGNNGLSKKINKNILVIEIDDKTLEEGNKDGNNLGRFPFNRKSYIPIIKNLNSVGVSLIGFDIIFNEKSNKESDILFGDTIKNAGNIIIGGFFGGKDMKDFNKSYFSEDILASGYFSPIINKLNHVVYGLYPFRKTNDGNYINHFTISLLKAYFGKIYNKNLFDDKLIYNDSYYKLYDNYNIPFAREGSKEILINFRKREDFKLQKKIISFIDIYDTDRFNKIKRYIDFKDKIVLIGASATGIKDIFYTPNGMEPGVFVHANMLNTILNKDYLKYYNKTIEYLIIFLLVILSVYLNIYYSGYRLLFSNITILIIFIFFVPFFILYISKEIINFPVEFFISLILSVTLSNILKYFIEDKRKSRLMKALGEYVSDDVADKILNTIAGDAIKSEKKRISIFFSDIAGFTTISEKFTPEKLVEFLNDYLGEMTEIIESINGHVDKYEGDAIMAFWGHREEHKESKSYDICLAALRQQEKIREFNLVWQEKYNQTLSVRMGLHCGDAIVGNIGGGKPGQKRNYTALGDSANLASRLEGVNKFYNTLICASEVIYTEEKENFEFRRLDKIKVKGKTVPIMIYELLSLKGKLDDKKMLIKLEFEKALDLYFNGNFNEAIIIFKKLAESGDNPSIIFEKRCNMFLKNPVDKDWDGVWTMAEK